MEFFTIVLFLQKVFPLDSTLDELVAFFESYGPMETVFMRKDAHKDFKVSLK